MKSKFVKLDVTHIIKKKYILGMCLGDIKNIPIVSISEDEVDMMRHPFEYRKPCAVGVVVSEGVLYNSLDGRFYIEAQLFPHTPADITIDSCEFMIDSEILTICAFIAFVDGEENSNG